MASGVTAQKVLLSFVGQVAGYGLSLLALSVLTRRLGPGPIGIVAYVMSFLGLFQPLLGLGMDSAHVKRVSEGRDFGLAISTFAAVKVVLVGVYLAVIIAAGYITGFLRNVHGGQSALLFTTLAAYTIVSSGIAAVPVETFRGRRETAKEVAVALLGRIVYAATAVMAASVSATATSLAIAYLVGSLASCAAGWHLLRPLQWSKPSRAMVHDYLSFGLPMVVAVAAGAVIVNVDQLMIGAFLTPADVAHYEVPRRLSVAFEFLSAAIMALLFPTVSAHASRGHTEALRDTLDRTLKYIHLVYLPLTALLLAFARAITVLLFGPAFIPAVPVLQTIVVFSLLQGLSRPASALVLGSGDSRVYAALSSLNVVVDVVLNLMFIPASFFGIRTLGLGPMGAALSSVLVSLGSDLMLYAVCRRQYGYKLPAYLVPMWGYALALGIPLWIVATKQQLLRFSMGGHAVAVVATSALWTLGYVALLWRAHVIGPDDWAFVKSVLNPRVLRDYVRGELA